MIPAVYAEGALDAPGASWQLTGELSPRATVRAADIDAHGDILNSYTRQRRTDGPEPAVPWAIYLADDERRYRLLAFDLDAKTPQAARAAEADAERIAGLLKRAGMPALICQSGPAGGRHVWTALAESVDAATVATLARLLRHLCPTLDIAPLTNPTTGCVRPPGAPHRAGGHSTVLSGDLEALKTSVSGSESVSKLVTILAQLVNVTEPAHVDAHTPLPLDEHGRLYLPGPRRPLPAVSAAALDEDAACGDASAVLWRILIGAAAARWRHADIAQLVAHSPGLEHIRTYRDRSQRKPRGQIDAARTLRRQWDKAVRYVATAPRQIGDDPTFDGRADQIATHAREIQARADAAAGRWTSGGGPADRRVLDVLCILALQAITATVEADIRRLALLAGIGRETARTALLRLADDGWITRARDADGPHGAHWQLAPATVIHSNLDHSRSQADPRPVGAGAAERTTLLASLTARLNAARHDLFTPGNGGLGHHAGNTYARTTDEPQTLTQLSLATGASTKDTAHTLNRLTSAGVLVSTPHGWRRPRADHRRAAADRAGTTGRLDNRATRYSIERELWAWWQAEHEWMRAPGRQAPGRRPSRGQLSLIPDVGTHAYGPHPRRYDGRLDWREARRIVEEERHGHAARRLADVEPIELLRSA